MTNGYVVPKDRVWRIEGLSPRQEPIGTTDLRVNGVIYMGTSRETAMTGNVEINIVQRQQVPIWLGPETQVKVGDSRGKVVVRELPVR